MAQNVAYAVAATVASGIYSCSPSTGTESRSPRVPA